MPRNHKALDDKKLVQLRSQALDYLPVALVPYVKTVCSGSDENRKWLVGWPNPDHLRQVSETCWDEQKRPKNLDAMIKFLKQNLHKPKQGFHCSFSTFIYPYIDIPQTTLNKLISDVAQIGGQEHYYSFDGNNGKPTHDSFFNLFHARMRGVCTEPTLQQMTHITDSIDSFLSTKLNTDDMMRWTIADRIHAELLKTSNKIIQVFTSQLKHIQLDYIDHIDRLLPQSSTTTLQKKTTSLPVFDDHPLAIPIRNIHTKLQEIQTYCCELERRVTESCEGLPSITLSITYLNQLHKACSGCICYVKQLPTQVTDTCQSLRYFSLSNQFATAISKVFSLDELEELFTYPPTHLVTHLVMHPNNISICEKHVAMIKHCQQHMTQTLELMIPALLASQAKIKTIIQDIHTHLRHTKTIYEHAIQHPKTTEISSKKDPKDPQTSDYLGSLTSLCLLNHSSIMKKQAEAAITKQLKKASFHQDRSHTHQIASNHDQEPICHQDPKIDPWFTVTYKDKSYKLGPQNLRLILDHSDSYLAHFCADDSVDLENFKNPLSEGHILNHNSRHQNGIKLHGHWCSIRKKGQGDRLICLILHLESDVLIMPHERVSHKQYEAYLKNPKPLITQQRHYQIHDHRHIHGLTAFA
ncbi:MAG: hypothetical protein VXY77_01290 [Pseudomonadota bacterium]|nr:hypothetical protein [Pseudomonadota bacterium]